MKQHYTLLELAVTVTVAALLAGTVLNGMSRMRDTAKRDRCLGNLKEIGVLAASYTTDHDGTLPALDRGSARDSWSTQMMGLNPTGKLGAAPGFVKGKYLSIGLLYCPAMKGVYRLDGTVGWWQNNPHYTMPGTVIASRSAQKIAAARWPGKSLFVFDGAAEFNGDTGMYRWARMFDFDRNDKWWGKPMARHQGNVNALALAGNVRSFRISDPRLPNRCFPFNEEESSREYINFN